MQKGRMLPDRKLLWRPVADVGLQERPAADTQCKLIELLWRPVADVGLQERPAANARQKGEDVT